MHFPPCAVRVWRWRTARLQEAFGECAQAKKYTYTVINDSLDEAVHKVQAILTAEGCRSLYTNIPQKEE